MLEAKKEWAMRVKYEKKALKAVKEAQEQEAARYNSKVHRSIKKCEVNAIKQMEKSRSKNYGLSTMERTLQAKSEKKKTLRISKAVRNLEEVENMLINNLRLQQHRERNAELKLEHAYETSAIPKSMRAASSLPPSLFSKFL